MNANRTLPAQPRRRPIAADDGVTLVELLVAISIMIIILAGVAAGATSGLGLARTNSDRIVAANIADEQISDVRAMDFADIPQSTVTDTATRGAVTYTWTREAEMVFLGTVQSCETPSDGANANRLSYLRVIVEVTWPNMAGVEPVRSETIIDPPVADYDPYRGHLVVQITDRNGESVSGVTVHVENADPATPATNTFETTDADGCAVFDSLGVAPGTTVGSYYVWVDEPGYVDRASGLSDTSEQDPQPVVNVVSGQMRKVEFAYDRASYLNVTALPGEAGGTLLANLPVTITNDNYNNGNGPVAFDNAAQLLNTPLHPFTAGFSVWAGRCADADPGTANRTRMATLPHTTTSGMVTVATAKITVTEQGRGDAVRNAVVRVIDACGTSYNAPVRTNNAGKVTIAMPYGEWTLQVVGRNPHPQGQGWPDVTLSPRPDGTTVNLHVRAGGGSGGDDDEDD